MDSAERIRRGEQFRRLHAIGEICVLPNPWDIGTARLFANLGFQGLATTSAGLAFSLGRRDGDAAVSRKETLTSRRLRRSLGELRARWQDREPRIREQFQQLAIWVANHR